MLASWEALAEVARKAGKEFASRSDRAEIVKLMKRADVELARRLATVKGTDSFTAIQARAFRAQIRIVLEQVKIELAGVVRRGGREQAIRAQKRAELLLQSAERLSLQVEKRGAVVGLDLVTVGNLSRVSRRVSNSLLANRKASVDRYGDAMVRDMEEVIARGLLTNASQDEIARKLTSRWPDEPNKGDNAGFRRRSYWGERIARTERANADSLASQAYMEQARAQVPDIKRKLVATFDDRTAWDSIAAHGQVRRLDEPFVDGKGRVYDRPPARPHDREVVIPWRDRYPEPEALRQKTLAEKEALAEGPYRYGSRRSNPRPKLRDVEERLARPKLSTKPQPRPMGARFRTTPRGEQAPSAAVAPVASRRAMKARRRAEKIKVWDQGMRDLESIRRAFAGASPAQATAIARGKADVRGGGSGRLEPIKIGIDTSERLVVLDGRHRIKAATEAGATSIAAMVERADGSYRKRMVALSRFEWVSSL